MLALSSHYVAYLLELLVSTWSNFIGKIVLHGGIYLYTASGFSIWKNKIKI